MRRYLAKSPRIHFTLAGEKYVLQSMDSQTRISQVHHVRTCVLRVRKEQLTVSSSWHQATQQLFCHQRFFFSLRIFDVITWHPCIATAARWCESEPEINSRPVSGPYEYLSLTVELELYSSPWNFGVLCRERSDQYRPFTALQLLDLERTLISVFFSAPLRSCLQFLVAEKAHKSHPCKSGATAIAYYSG